MVTRRKTKGANQKKDRKIRPESVNPLKLAIRGLYKSATRWLSWYGVGLASADRLPVVVRILQERERADQKKIGTLQVGEAGQHDYQI